MKNENMAFMMPILQKYFYLYHKVPNFYVLTQHPFIKYHKIIKKATVICMISGKEGDRLLFTKLNGS